MHSIPDPRAAPDPRCTCLLLRRASRRTTQFYDDHLRGAGLRTTQFSVLAQLRHADGATLGELAERLSMDRTTLTRSLRPLTDARWVNAGSDPQDRRRTRLELTPAGREVLRAAVPLWRDAQRALRERLGGAIVGDLHAALDDTLERLG
jgi:DNA-binding MarR family transcriptional regulator